MRLLNQNSNERGVFTFRICAFCMMLSIFFGVIFAENVSATEPEGMLIAKIETRGNLYISSEKILATAIIREGQQFDKVRISEGVKRIAGLKGIEHAYYNTEIIDNKVNLTFVVTEKKAVRSITFGGNNKYNDKKLSGLLDFKRGNFLDRSVVEAGRGKLLEYYLKKGYAFVKIDFDQTQLDVGNVHYQVESDPRVKIKKIKFLGNDSIKTGELKKVIKTKPRKWLVLQKHLQSEELENDILKLRKAYDRKGYLDTTIDAERLFNEKKDKVNVVFNVKEGPRYKIEKIAIVGNKHFNVDTISKEFKLKTGDYYSEEISRDDAEEILRLYRQIGFIDAEVAHQRSFSSPGKVLSEFKIREGERFRIGMVNITGNKDVQDKVIRRVLDESEFKPGELYNAHIAAGDGTGELEKEVRQNTYAESITITPTGDKPGQKDAEVRITEGKTGSIMFGAGVSSQDGLIGRLFLTREILISKIGRKFGENFSQTKPSRVQVRDFEYRWSRVLMSASIRLVLPTHTCVTNQLRLMCPLHLTKGRWKVMTKEDLDHLSALRNVKKKADTGVLGSDLKTWILQVLKLAPQAMLQRSKAITCWQE